MTFNKKLLLVSLLSIVQYGTAFADELTQTYPTIGGVTPSFGVEFFLYLLNMSIVAGAIIALVGLTYQGITIMTAGENAGKVTEAKRSITGLFLGLTILAGSTLILKAINPELLKMQLPSLGDLQPPVNVDFNFDPKNKEVKYTEIPVGATIESILNAVSTSPSQAYNYSSVKVKTGGPSTEEICYLYDKNGNAIDKNNDGSITEMDEFQGVDFRICINELLKATEHKLLYLNDGKYRCGIPGINDEDSPAPMPNIEDFDFEPTKKWNEYLRVLYDDYKKNGRTALNVNYHDWDKENWIDMINADENTPNTTIVEIPPKERCRYWGTCEDDGLNGVINYLKESIRNGCTCSETGAKTTDEYDPEYVGCEGAAIGGQSPTRSGGTYCSSLPGCNSICWCDDGCDSGVPGAYSNGPYVGCCGGPRGRSQSCQNPSFNNIFNPNNPYYQHDPCLKRRSMDCMREFINIITYGDVNTKQSCSAQENKQGPAKPIEMGWQCSDFVYNSDAEITKGRNTEFLLAYYQRLISFKKYYRARMQDLEKEEKYMMKDKRLEIYSRAELQELQQKNKEVYVSSQSDLGLSVPYETGTYRRRFNCASYEDSVELNSKNVYEDDEYRRGMFTCNWNQDKYWQTQRDNKLIRIKTGDFISNLHVDKSMEITGPDSEELEDLDEDQRICSRGELETLEGKNALFNNVESSCPGTYGSTPKLEGAPAAAFDTTKRRFVQWKDDIYKTGGYAYLDGTEKYWTGEDMATDGDPLTFYALTKPENLVDPYYTGRDKMPYYFKTAFIDYTQYSENSAIDTEIGVERGFLVPSLIPVGQLSYHTKIYTKQMIRMIDRTLEQMEASIIALDNIANVYVEGGAAEEGRDYSGISAISNETGHYLNGGAVSTGCDCATCRNRSNCYCTNPCIGCCGCCGEWHCDDFCTGCKPQNQSVCATCSKVVRYSYFIEDSYYAYYGPKGNPNPEPLADDIINDDLPRSLKMIVHNMSCPKEGGSYATKSKYVGKKERMPILGRKEELIGSVEVEYDRQSAIVSGSKTTSNITAYYTLLIKNKTNGKKKEFTGTKGNPWVGHGEISDILSKGKNLLEFYVVSEKDFVETTDIYILFEEFVSGESICEGGCNKNFPEYVPPAGYAVKECNAWNRKLKEERPCIDYEDDIVVMLIPGNPCECDPDYTKKPYKRECTNGGVPTEGGGGEGCGAYTCRCTDGTQKRCHVSEPVLYLYPEKETEVNVKLAFPGEFTVDVPDYGKDGWNVVASPTGRLKNKGDGKDYDYLYWEADIDDLEFDMTKGFVIEGERTKEFLIEKLGEMGLIEKEIDDFIKYWEPLMRNNPYNLIHFSEQEYENMVNISVTPSPDSVLRVFMAYKPLKEKIEVVPQILTKMERKGFVVVEWGGTKLANEEISRFECLINNKNTFTNACKAE
jgi:hypothetical protein